MHCLRPTNGGQPQSLLHDQRAAHPLQADIYFYLPCLKVHT